MEITVGMKIPDQADLKDEKYGKKILTDPDADIVYRELT